MSALCRDDAGLTRTEISGLFGRNRTAGQIGRALSTLKKKGKIRRGEIETGGRNAEVWFALRRDLNS